MSFQEAEMKMSTEGFQWEWKTNGDVTIWYQLPAFYRLPHTGEEVWFNQVTANHCSYYKSHPMVSRIQKAPGIPRTSKAPKQQYTGFELAASYKNSREMSSELTLIG